MYKYYDVQCEDCGNEFEVFIGDDEEVPICPHCCGSNIKRLYTTFNYKLLYDNKRHICGWSDNNYETSQYYRKVKEARARGENVKAPDD